MEYEFTFVVDGATVDDDEAVSRLEDKLDAMLARGAGLNLLTISCEGDSAIEAAVQAAEQARTCVPGLKILRLDRDVVGVAEIAERTERSLQNVHQWTRGERLNRGTPFPAPEGTAGRVHVWLWSEINEWLRQHGLDDGLNYAGRLDMARIDAILANGFSMTFESAPLEGFAEARQDVLAKLHANGVSFAQFISTLPPARNTGERLTVVVAGADEPAHGVMKFLSSLGDSVLVTGTGEEIMGVYFTTDESGPQVVVPVPETSTVWQWMELVREQPTATFVPDSTEQLLESARVGSWRAGKAEAA